jgi:two-component system C4-dicarboxylate transport response regulator DctD
MTRTILIVEDDDQCRKILEMTLSSIGGVTVRAVATAEDALPHLVSEEIGALITDLGLPRMNGFDLIEFARSQSGSAKLSVLVVSGESGHDTRARLSALGADAFFSKPFYPSEIRQELLNLIGDSEAKAYENCDKM